MTKTVCLDERSNVFLDMTPGTNVLCVRKEILYTPDPEQPSLTYDDVCEFYKEREFFTQRSLKHPCIAQGYSFMAQPESSKIVLTMDFIPGGDLFELLRSECSSFTRAHEYIMIFALAKTMEFIHSKNIVYRDMKTSNVMIDESFLPVLIDFGHARFLSAESGIGPCNFTDYTQLTFGLGTKRYSPPEMLDQAAFSNYFEKEFKPEVAKKIDVYAFAMVVYEILTRKLPFDGLDDLDAIAKIKAGVKPSTDGTIDHFDALVASVLQPAWEKNPQERPTMSDLAESILDTAEDCLLDDDLRTFNRFAHNWDAFVSRYDQQSDLSTTIHGTTENLEHCANVLGIPRSKGILASLNS